MGTDYPHLKGKARRFAREAAEFAYHEAERRREQRRKALLRKKQQRQRKKL